MKLLVVVDMQKDFIDGSLGTGEAVSIVNNVNNKIKNFDGIVVYTRDAHDDNYMNHQEGKNLPVVHCKKGTPGFEIQVDTSIKNKPSDKNINYFKDYYDKDAFASVDLANDIKNAFEKGKIESAEFIGLCTDICVLANVITTKAFAPELKIIVDSSCCAGVTPEKHTAALEAMRSCQAQVI